MFNITFPSTDTELLPDRSGKLRPGIGVRQDEQDGSASDDSGRLDRKRDRLQLEAEEEEHEEQVG